MEYDLISQDNKNVEYFLYTICKTKSQNGVCVTNRLKNQIHRCEELLQMMHL